MKATETQIGGEHYQQYKFQPTEFLHINNVPFIEGNVIKYILRHKHKNGLQDLLKAKHYIDLLIQFEYHESKEESHFSISESGAEGNTQGNTP